MRLDLRWRLALGGAALVILVAVGAVGIRPIVARLLGPKGGVPPSVSLFPVTAVVIGTATPVPMVTPFVVGTSVPGGETAAAPTLPPLVIAAPTPSPDLALVGAPLVLTSGTTRSVAGQIRNGGTKPLSALMTATFADSAGKSVGTASGLVGDIQPGETRLFVLTAAQVPDDYTAVTPRIDTSFAGKPLPPMTIRSITVRDTVAGPAVAGDLTNGDTAAHSVLLVAGLFDATGKLVGVATGNVGQIAAGATKPFQLPTSRPVPAYQEIRVQVSALLQ